VDICSDQCTYGHREWLMKRNCSLTPRQLGLSYLVLCAASFGVASIWLLRGTWVVLAFSMIEMMAAAVAWFIYARHATDHEYVRLTETCLLVNQMEAGRILTVRLDPRQTRISPPACYGAMVQLEAPGTRIEVGRHVWPSRRRQLADELRDGLRAAP
jgi:uncharacterized membrane protein